jgi:hypothetical protein
MKLRPRRMKLGRPLATRNGPGDVLLWKRLRVVQQLLAAAVVLVL